MGNDNEDMKEATLKQRRSNTRHLRRLIERGEIRVNVDAGIVSWPNGEPIHVQKNGGGYLRFKIQRNGCRFFFVHKAVYLASGRSYRHDRHIDHGDSNPENNCIWNLCQMTPKENQRKARERLKEKFEKEFPAPF